MGTKELSAVGNVATAEKSAVAIKGNPVLTRVEIEPSENGGFTLKEHYRLESPKGRSVPVYELSGCREPKTFTFETFASMAAHLQRLFGRDGKR